MRLSITVACLLAVAFVPLARAGDFEETYQKSVRAVVFISVIDKDWNPSFGSGVIIDSQLGLILTAYHVVGEGKLIAAHPPEFNGSGKLITDAQHYGPVNDANQCTVVARDSKRDLALVRFKFPPKGLKSIPLAAKSARPGQVLFTIGSDAQESMFHFASGNVRTVYDAKYKYPDGQRIAATVIESTTPTNPGDSGGPLLNDAGEIVGINSGFVQGANGVHKGIDLSEVTLFVDSARKNLRTK